MNIRNLLILVFLGILTTLKSQIVPDPDLFYGPDQLLLNGRLYSYYPPYGTAGHQFVFNKEFSTGSVVIKNQNFDNVLLNYDLVNQQLLLKYRNMQGGFSILEVPKGFLSSFSIGEKKFELLQFEGNKTFFQVIGNSDTKILIYRWKSIGFSTTPETSGYRFSDPVKSYWVLKSGNFYPFSSGKSFRKIFDPDERQAIKTFMHKNRIRIKNASDQDLEKLADFTGKTR